MVIMRKYIPLFLLMGFIFSTACSSGGNEPGVTAVIIPSPSPTSLPPQVETPTATNSFIPIIEAIGTPTMPPPTETPVVEVTPSPTAETMSPIDSIALEPVITGGLEMITFLTHANDNRLFVLEQVGRIRIIDNGQLIEQPFLDITDRVGSASSEQGLLGLAFHPDYASPGAAMEGNFFVNYTDYSGNTHISRFSVSADDPNRADKQSEVEYLAQNQPYPNHNGGSLAFGPDGYLYVGLGDGGSANDPLLAGQDLSTWLGKVLRLDVDSKENAYDIPADNPFIGTTGAMPEIWAYGLRNPWRFSFDRLKGDFYIADVGQNTWEEVNFQPASSAGGENYGWNIMEGSHCFETQSCGQANLTLPIFEYDHSTGCSITGGYIYRGQAHPELTGNYFVSDYCSGIIWRLFKDGKRWVNKPILDSDLIISSFGEDNNGEIYVLNYWNGGIYHIVPGE